MAGIFTQAQVDFNVGKSVLRGFNRLDPDHMGVPSYNTTTRTFTLTPDNTYFEFWAGREKFTKTTAQSVIWDDTTATYYFYFDTDGVLQFVDATALSATVFQTSAICGMVYWNAVESAAFIQAVDEQHGIDMRPSTHLRLHLCDGAKWAAPGGNVTGLVDESDTYTGISNQLSFDEDIPMMTLASTTHPFIYKEGADGAWVESATPNNSVGHDGGGNTYYNQNTGSTWQLTAAPSSGDYVIYYFLWTHDANNPIKKIVGQQYYASRNDARDAIEKEVGNIELDGLPTQEAYFMYAYIVKTNGEIEADGDGFTYVDMRGKHQFSAV